MTFLSTIVKVSYRNKLRYVTLLYIVSIAFELGRRF